MSLACKVLSQSVYVAQEETCSNLLKCNSYDKHAHDLLRDNQSAPGCNL